MLVARFLEFSQHVAPERRLGHFAVRCLGIPEAEAVVMLGQEEDVAHARLLGGARPLIRVAARSLKVADILDTARPLLAREGAEGPADKHAPFQILELRCPLLHINRRICREKR